MAIIMVYDGSQNLIEALIQFIILDPVHNYYYIL